MSAMSGLDVPEGRVIIRQGLGSVEDMSTNIHRIINITDSCDTPLVPDMKTYFSAINSYGVILFALGALALAALTLLLADTLRKCLKGQTTEIYTRTALILSVYPVVGCSSYCAMLVPRSQLLTEAITQGAFTVAMYQLFCMIVAYCGGSEQFIQRVKPAHVDTRVLPCCCWPCCFIPRPPLTKKTLMSLRLLVLQLPIVQGIIYIILLVMWAEEDSLYQVNYVYVQPVVVASILSGVWGVIMTVKCASQVLPGGKLLKEKFLAVQCVLLFAKFQGCLVRIIPTNFLPCRFPLTPSLYLNLIYNTLMLTEMVLLSLWARKLYTSDVTETEQLFSDENIKKVKSLDCKDEIFKIDVNGGVENKTFTSE